ncbi:MAG: hypothetical protein QXD23_02370 [Candidatus Micrarchaeaceae archaeon]
MNNNSLIERMLYRLVKKHIAGTTMSSMISKVAELNKKGLPVSVTFLSGNIDTKAKAKYITSTYLELIRRLSRLGFKASVHIRAEQLGILLDTGITIDNFNEILNTGRKCGIFVWLQLPGEKISFKENLNGEKGYGVAVEEKYAQSLLNDLSYKTPIKIMFNEHHQYETNENKDKKTKNKKVKTKKIKKPKSQIDLFTKKGSIVLSSPPEHIIAELINQKNKNRSKVVLEFKLGYSNKKLSKYIKKNKNITMNVPFGKDWAEFAMNSVPEGYMRFLANNLLTDKKNN